MQAVQARGIRPREACSSHRVHGRLLDTRQGGGHASHARHCGANVRPRRRARRAALRRVLQLVQRQERVGAAHLEDLSLVKQRLRGMTQQCSARRVAARLHGAEVRVAHCAPAPRRLRHRQAFPAAWRAPPPRQRRAEAPSGAQPAQAPQAPLLQQRAARCHPARDCCSCSCSCSCSCCGCARCVGCGCGFADAAATQSRARQPRPAGCAPARPKRHAEEGGRPPAPAATPSWGALQRPFAASAHPACARPR